MATQNTKPRIAVHKFSSCDGCQLAFLNLGEDLLALNELVDIVHFAEAGMLDEGTKVDMAFVEGSISTQADIEHIHRIRDQSHYLITIGACATAGGLQALRNLSEGGWLQAIYPEPAYIDSLQHVMPISEQVRVDLELWGCPIDKRQLVSVIRSLLWGVIPKLEQNKVCLECKRQQKVCVMVTRGTACMGPVTHTGCGALCPSAGRGCYGCYGPAENPNTAALGQWFAGLGLLPDQIVRQFLAINSQAEPFTTAGKRWKDKS